MAWQVWWALVLGFAISGDRPGVGPARASPADAGRGGAGAAVARDLLGAASSSCSYAAVAIARSLFAKGRLGGQRAGVPVRLHQPGVGARPGAVDPDRLAVHGRRVPGRDRDDRADGAGAAPVRQPRRSSPRPATTRCRPTPGHQHHTAGSELGWRERLTSAAAWSDVAHNFRGDWQMLWREIGIGFLLAGFIAQVPNSVFQALFLQSTPRRRSRRSRTRWSDR